MTARRGVAAVLVACAVALGAAGCSSSGDEKSSKTTELDKLGPEVTKLRLEVEQLRQEVQSLRQELSLGTGSSDGSTTTDTGGTGSTPSTTLLPG